MRIETILSPGDLPQLARRDLSGAACVVFDILRATSTFVTALQNGAERIIPVGEIPEAVAVKQKFPDALLAGERDGVKIRAAQSGGTDFDLGNSPREFTAEKIHGRTIVSTTTNGTRALRACTKAKQVFAGSFLNLTATADFLKQNDFAQILLICAGTGDGVADEDVLAAGAMIDLLTGSAAPAGEFRPHLTTSPSDFAHQSFQATRSDLYLAMTRAKNGARLLSIPDLAGDVVFCSQRDIYPLVVAMDGAGALRKI